MTAQTSVPTPLSPPGRSPAGLPRRLGAEALARLRAIAFLRRELLAGEGLQIGYSTDPHMAPHTVLTHREVLEAELDPGIRARLAPFGGDLREGLTSGMALKLIADLPGAVAGALADYTLTHRHGDRGRFRFYAPPHSIAPCADMTGICLVGLWRAGALEAEALRSGALEILKGAATETLAAEDNVSHGGSNGPLFEGVLKIYWDDHPDGPLRRRGRKHDAVVVCDGLHAVLLAAREAELDLGALQVPLFAHRADGSEATHTLPAEEIVRRSVAWLHRYCTSGDLLSGTTYYGCSTFLMALLADLIADGGEWTAALRAPLHEALREWRRRRAGEALHLERSALALAGALFAARRSGLQGEDLDGWTGVLVGQQAADGSWAPAPWYRMRTRPLFYGNATSTTVMALAALSVA